jgi:hypothetical protein
VARPPRPCARAGRPCHNPLCKQFCKD